MRAMPIHQNVVGRPIELFSSAYSFLFLFLFLGRGLYIILRREPLYSHVTEEKSVVIYLSKSLSYGHQPPTLSLGGVHGPSYPGHANQLGWDGME